MDQNRKGQNVQHFIKLSAFSGFKFNLIYRVCDVKLLEKSWTGPLSWETNP